MKNRVLQSSAKKRAAFTLVEVMLATAILGMLVLMFATIISQTSNLWKRTTGKIEQFREARAAFETMTTRLSQATLNTYWDYDKSPPTKYERRSELRFISGPSVTLLNSSNNPTHSIFFQAPLGQTEKPEFQGFENLLCTCGFYLEFGDDKNLRPSFVTEAVAPLRYRHRLMQFIAPTETSKIYNYTSGIVATGALPKAVTYKDKTWYNTLYSVAGYSRPIAENIIALIITPRLAKSDELALGGGSVTDESPLAPNYLYDSSNTGAGGPSKPLLNSLAQLPPILQVTMVAIDEGSASRLITGSTDPFIASPFLVKDKFATSSQYSTDLLLEKGGATSLEGALIEKATNYRIFSTNVAIRGAKWSRQQ